MDLEKGKLLTLADDHEYCIVDKFINEDNCYVFLVDINDNANIIFGKIIDDRVVELNDFNELDMVIKNFYNNLYNNC